MTSEDIYFIMEKQVREHTHFRCSIGKDLATKILTNGIKNLTIPELTSFLGTFIVFYQMHALELIAKNLLEKNFSETNEKE